MSIFWKHLKSCAHKESAFAIGSQALIWQVFFFYIPLFLTLCMGVMQLSESGHFKRLTFANFTPLFDISYLVIISLSLGLGAVTALGSLALAYPLAYFITFQSQRRKVVFLFLLLLPFWANFLLHVYSWFFILEREGFLNQALQMLGLTSSPLHFLNSPFAIIIVMIYHYLPFMVLPIFSSLERFDRSLLEASYDLGACQRETFIRIMLPLTLPGIRTGFFIVFISGFGEFIIPELMGGNKFYFVGNVISAYILGDHTAGIGAAFMVMSFLFLAVVATSIAYLFRKLADRLARKGTI